MDKTKGLVDLLISATQAKEKEAAGGRQTGRRGKEEIEAGGKLGGEEGKQ